MLARPVVTSTAALPAIVAFFVISCFIWLALETHCWAELALIGGRWERGCVLGDPYVARLELGLADRSFFWKVVELQNGLLLLSLFTYLLVGADLVESGPR